MKRHILLGLTALGLVALTPTQSKADDGFRIYVNPGYQQDRPYYYDGDGYRHYYRHGDEYRWHRYHHRHHYDRDDDRDGDRD